MDEQYSVKINRSEGIVEISGADKDWIAAQLDKLGGWLSGPASAREPNVVQLRADTKTAVRTGDPKEPRQRRAGARRANRKPELEALLTAEVKKKLQAYMDERSGYKSQPDQLAIMATFLLDELNWSEIDEDDIYTVFVSMGWATPGNPSSTMNNAQQRKKYFGPFNNGKMQLSHTGENFGRTGALQPKKTTPPAV